jgi:hypothetical protein
MTRTEFLVHIALDAEGVPVQELEAMKAAEAIRAKELATAGRWCGCGGFPDTGPTTGCGAHGVKSSSTLLLTRCRCGNS